MGHSGSKAVGVLDIPRSTAAYSTRTLQEELLKVEGVKSARVNNVYQKVTVEFDPSLTSLDSIRKVIRYVSSLPSTMH